MNRKALYLAAPLALFAVAALAQPPQSSAPKIMDSPPGIPVYKDRIVSGEPKTGAVNGTTLAPHPLKTTRPSPKRCCAMPMTPTGCRCAATMKAMAFPN
jgi:hypothetical protein